MTHRVCIIGAGSFGSVVARIAAAGVKANPETFQQEIAWWARRPEVVAEINEKHTNSQYIGPAALPTSLRASTDLKAVVSGASICIMGLPGDYVSGDCVVSLIKSLLVIDGRVVPFTELMSRGLRGRPMAALMGPNICREMAMDEFAEATLGCKDNDLWPVLRQLFETPLFHVDMSSNVVGVEMCGCLKNTITISCGIAAGLDWGHNIKAALIRRGLLEIGQFLRQFMGVDCRVLLDAAGLGDLLLSCTIGRGQLLAAAFVKARGKRNWSELEGELMGGMKLPDLHNVERVYRLLAMQDRGLERYPLLAATYRIAFEGAAPESILEPLHTSSPVLDWSAPLAPEVGLKRQRS